VDGEKPDNDSPILFQCGAAALPNHPPEQTGDSVGFFPFLALSPVARRSPGAFGRKGDLTKSEFLLAKRFIFRNIEREIQLARVDGAALQALGITLDAGLRVDATGHYWVVVESYCRDLKKAFDDLQVHLYGP
jgi:hypothetical protein